MPRRCTTPPATSGRFCEQQGLDFDAFKHYIPLLRYGTADEIASVTMFLCSGAPGFIVGAVVVCDGGWTIAAPGSFD